jgi:hypothetical protein
MRRHRKWIVPSILFVIAMGLAPAPAVGSSSDGPLSDRAAILPTSEIREGMILTGYSPVRGTEPSGVAPASPRRATTCSSVISRG